MVNDESHKQVIRGLVSNSNNNFIPIYGNKKWN